MDTSAHMRTIAAARMKANRKNRAPLFGRAVEALAAARTLGDSDGPLVFAVEDGEPLEEKVLRRLLEPLRVPVVHGFPSSFPGLGGPGDGGEHHDSRRPPPRLVRKTASGGSGSLPARNMMA